MWKEFNLFYVEQIQSVLIWTNFACAWIKSLITIEQYLFKTFVFNLAIFARIWSDPIYQFFLVLTDIF